MSNSISILTEQSKTVIGDSTASLQGNVLAHVNGDWAYHNAMRVYNSVYTPPSGFTIPTQSLRMLLSDPSGNDLVVIVPCTATSGTNPFTPGTAPILISSPTSLSLPVGSTAQFGVSVVSPTTPTYQWTKNTLNIAGGSSSVYRITNITTVDAGTFACVVSNNYGAVTSGDAILVVTSSSSGTGTAQLPIIAYQQPNPAQIIDVNTATSLTTYVELAIDVASDSAVSFVWQRNGANIVYTPDTGVPQTYITEQSWAGHAHGSLLTVRISAEAGHAAYIWQFRVFCTNANGTVISQTWVVRVTYAP